MPVTSPTAIDALPTPPSANDAVNFPARGDSFLGALPTFRTQTNAIATNVYNNAVDAAASASSASTDAATATTKAAEALSSANTASSAAAGWQATSSSSIALTTGAKSITASTGKLFTAGTNIKIKRTSDPLNTYAFSTVTTYNSSTGAMTFTLATGDITGTGTFTDWTIELSGAKGAAGVGDLIAANNLSDVPNKATARTNLGLAIGTDVQAYNANLAALAGLTGASNKLAYFTGASALALTDLSAFGRSLIDDADDSAARTTLGLGTAATLNHGTSAGNLVRLDPSTGKLPAVDGSQLTGLATGGGFTGGQRFLTSGSYTFEAGKKYLLWGKGGGGGGAGPKIADGIGTGASGGGEGGEFFGLFTPTTTFTATITIGSGGAGGAYESSSGNNGIQGGTTSITGAGISGTIEAQGGGGGLRQNFSGLLGSASSRGGPATFSISNGVGVGIEGSPSGVPTLEGSSSTYNWYPSPGAGKGGGTRNMAPANNSGGGGCGGAVFLNGQDGAAGFCLILSS